MFSTSLNTNTNTHTIGTLDTQHLPWRKSIHIFIPPSSSFLKPLRDYAWGLFVNVWFRTYVQRAIHVNIDVFYKWFPWAHALQTLNSIKLVTTNTKKILWWRPKFFDIETLKFFMLSESPKENFLHCYRTVSFLKRIETIKFRLKKIQSLFFLGIISPSGMLTSHIVSVHTTIWKAK